MPSINHTDDGVSLLTLSVFGCNLSIWVTVAVWRLW